MLAASGSNHANRSYEQIDREIVAEAGRIDTAEDERYGDARGDELPEQLTARNGRRAWLREARERLERERAANSEPVPRDRSERLAIYAAYPARVGDARGAPLRRPAEAIGTTERELKKAGVEERPEVVLADAG
jgi:hypothetical protein